MPDLISPDRIPEILKQIEGWEFVSDSSSICRTYSFENFHQTMAFVNAMAWIAHSMDHHPDIEAGYNSCTLTFTTHSAGGLTSLDVEAARRVNDL